MVLLPWLVAADPAVPPPDGMVLIPPGEYRPLFRGFTDPPERPVPAFFLDANPVTNGDFLEFVRAQPKWRRSQVKRLFAEAGYLRHWADDLRLADPAAETARQPVVNVSWFAARAYAAWRGRRLPTTAEWERTAAIGFTHPLGAQDPEFVRVLTHWYSTPTPAILAPVGSQRPNRQGVYDLHGLIWEWTADFNSSLATGDARGDSGLERQLFCGAGSLGVGDRTNFPAFMREGFRSALKAAYTVHNLGFRCAADLPSGWAATTPASPTP